MPSGHPGSFAGYLWRWALSSARALISLALLRYPPCVWGCPSREPWSPWLFRRVVRSTFGAFRCRSWCAPLRGTQALPNA